MALAVAVRKMADTEAEKLHLEFEREKWRGELDLRTRELLVKEREIDRSRWANPLVIAVFAAAIAATGNAGVAWLTSVEQHRLESERAESAQQLEEGRSEAARILEAIKTNDPDKAAKNLKFLVGAGLISSPKIKQELNEFLARTKPEEFPNFSSDPRRICVPTGPTNSPCLRFYLNPQTGLYDMPPGGEKISCSDCRTS